MDSLGSIDAIRSINLNEVGAEEKSRILEKAVQDFEAIFINQMLKSMRSTVEEGSLFHGGSGEKMYAEMMDAEMSKSIAAGGGIGLKGILATHFDKEFDALEKTLKGHSAVERTLGREPGGSVLEKIAEKLKIGRLGGVKIPVIGTISSLFGLRTDPINGSTKFHAGVDIAAPEGSKVYPATSGRVLFSGNKDGFGSVVEVKHNNGLVSRYAHNSENLVKKGDLVGVNDPIALVGSTGRSTGAHLHFEVLKDGSAIDPGAMIRVDI
ncbi:MAG: peptidoglycan DD-metalloendopeptidase family protein [Proteobacteria bacterium]|nr:peptidoglycan DD-metalloendopeptidase family protein [Pseudomonadota bacterium]